MLKRTKKIALLLLAVLVAAIVFAFAFISPIAKYLIHKYDKEFINREVKIDGLWINILSGSLALKDVTLFELDGKTPFVKFTKLESQISIPKLIGGAYDISYVKLTDAQVWLTFKNGKFNYEDMVAKFSNTDTNPNPVNEAPLKYWVKNIVIQNGAVTYNNPDLQYLIEAIKINISTPGIAYNQNNLNSKIDLAFKSGGAISTTFNTNLSNSDYSMQAAITNFDLHVWYPYLKDLMNTKDLLGTINTTFNLKGNFNTPEQIALSGKLDLNHFAILDPLNIPLVTCTKLDVGVDTLNVSKGLYNLSQIDFTQPYVLFEMYDNGNNFYRLLSDTTISAAQAIEEASADGNMFTLMFGYVADIAKNFTITNYALQQFKINQGHVIYHDYTLPQSFQFDIDQLNMQGNNLRSTNQDIALHATALLNKTGSTDMEMHINPQDFSDASLNYYIKDVNISDFNAYVNHYVGHSFLACVIYYKSTNTLKQNQLNSQNYFIVNQVGIGGKSNKNAAYNLPMKLAVGLLKNHKGNIDLKIPITGNLNDPNYNIGKVVWQVVKNILLKAATAPYKLVTNLFGGNEESYKSMAFDYKVADFGKEFYKVLDNLAELVKQKPEVNIGLTQQSNMNVETEYLAELETKKRYYENIHGRMDSITPALADSLELINIKDSSFIAYVNKQLNSNDLLTPIQQKCVQFIGQPALSIMVQKRMQYRNDLIKKYLGNIHKLPASRFNVSNTTQQSFANTQSINVYVINYLANDSTQMQ